MRRTHGRRMSQRQVIAVARLRAVRTARSHTYPSRRAGVDRISSLRVRAAQKPRAPAEGAAGSRIATPLMEKDTRGQRRRGLVRARHR